MKITDILQVEDGFHHKALYLSENAFSAYEKAEAMKACVKMLASIQVSFVRLDYARFVAKLFKVKQDYVLHEVQSFESDNEGVNEQALAEVKNLLPEGADENLWLTYGYFQLDDPKKPFETGYYFAEGNNNNYVKRSNFVIKPLFHLYSKEDNKRMIEVTNGFVNTVLEMPSRHMISLEAFSGIMYEEGHFLFEGNKSQLLRINRKIGDQFPKAFELKTLGWQQEGFFSYADCISTEKLISFNDLGIAEFDDKNFFSPSCSSIYKHMRADDDPYENDRYLNYKQCPISLEEWSNLFCSVYGTEHGTVGICYILITCFRDLVFKLDNNCPHLYAYGEKRSGKSKFMESISSFFFNPLRSFNLNSGTDFAFANYLSRFRNCFAFMNEFDDKAIKEEWFQALKAAYDGEGRERGKGGSRNRTEIQKINSTIGLAGQYLSTRDDNSLLSRSIVLTFRPNEKRTKELNNNYDKLKTMEEKGMNSLVFEVMRHRKLVEDRYQTVFHDCFDLMRTHCKTRNVKFEDRINRNHCALLAMAKLFAKELSLPFKFNDFFELVMEKVIDLTRLMSQSDILSEFWRIIMSMADNSDIIRGYHYRLEAKESIQLKGEKDMKFPVPKRLLLLRFSGVYSMYKQNYRKETGKEAMNQESIKSYFGNRDYYLGITDNVRFRGYDKHGKEFSTNPTSAYVFDYETLEKQGINFDFSPDNSPEKTTPEPEIFDNNPFKDTFFNDK
jgi:hypothetical protein